jgi:hypothetical protein
MLTAILPTTFVLGWKSLPGTNANCEHLKITAAKSLLGPFKNNLKNIVNKAAAVPRNYPLR